MKFAAKLASIAVTATGLTPAVSQPPPTVTLLTYNVEGLPWPVASDRATALDAIATRLMALRRQGRQPHLVAVQEAFLPQAKAIGRAAGYRYEAFGPAQDAIAPARLTAEDQSFLAGAHFINGERAGKRVDSGLAIFSDYPIVAVHRMAYPVCAGYDCLANKGALAVQVSVPGVVTPLTVIDTHLNSGTASGVPRARSTYAYKRQIDALRVFLEEIAWSGSPMLVAGDFNVGNHLDRRSYFLSQLLRASTGLSAVEDACGRGSGCQADRGVAESIHRGKDWLLYRASRTIAPMPVDLAAPFGRAADGTMLSDHIGVSVTYALRPSMRPAQARLEVASR